MPRMESLRSTFFEDPFVVYVVLILVAIVMGGMWYGRRERKWLLGLIVPVALAGGVFLLERAVVTDREEIWTALDEIAEGVKADDVEAVAKHLDEKFTGMGLGPLRLGKAATLVKVKALMALYAVGEMRYTGRREVTFTGPGLARSRIQTLVFYDRPVEGGRVPMNWEVEWVKGEAGWKIRRVEQRSLQLP